MTNEEYLRIFHGIENPEQQNLNETKQQEQWQSLNETPDVSQFKIEENVNCGWGTEDFQIESRINGVQQQRNSNPFQHQQRRKPNRGGQNLNGLDQFIDDDDNLNEVVQQQKPTTSTSSDFTEKIEDQDIVSVEMFERMNNNGLMTLHQKIFR